MGTYPENPEGYIIAFRQYFGELSSTDPNRFPTCKHKIWRGKGYIFLFNRTLEIPMDFGCSTQLLDCMPSLNVIFIKRRSTFGLLTSTGRLEGEIKICNHRNFLIESFSIAIILLREEGKSKLATSSAKNALASGGNNHSPLAIPCSGQGPGGLDYETLGKQDKEDIF